MRGGAVYVNFKGISLAGSTQESPVTIPGIYNRIEGAYPGKEIIITNAVVAASGKSETYSAYVGVSSGNFVVNYNTYITTDGKVVINRIVITQDDEVYLTTTSTN